MKSPNRNVGIWTQVIGMIFHSNFIRDIYIQQHMWVYKNNVKWNQPTQENARFMYTVP